MKSVEIRLDALYSCEICGTIFHRPVIVRTGKEAQDFIRRQLHGMSPEDQERLKEVIDAEVEAGRLIPTERAEEVTDCSEMRTFSCTKLKCPQGHENLPVGTGYAFTCDECGRDTFLNIPAAARPSQVTCHHCHTIFSTDWTLVGCR